MNARERLPDRRPCESFDIQVANLSCKFSVGRFPNKEVGEVFISNHKAGNAADVAARDVGILISLLLQHGCAAETIARALSRNTDGSASGIATAVLDKILAGAGDK
jgi:hypothetical protein